MEGGTGVQISPPRVRRVAGAGKDGDAVPIQTRASVEDSVAPASLSVPTASHAEVRRGLDQVWRKTRGPIVATVSNKEPRHNKRIDESAVLGVNQ